MSSNILTLSLAIVKSVSDRNVKVKNNITDFNDELEPLLGGGIKDAVPAVDDLVIVFTLNNSNLGRYYIPVGYSYSNLTADADKIQLEAPNGDVEIDGSEVILGAGASDYIALAQKVDDAISNITSALTTLNTQLAAHIHTSAAAGAPTSPPTNFVWSDPGTQSSVACDKCKAE